MATIKILIAEDSEIITSRLLSLLRPIKNVEVVNVVKSGEAAIEFLNLSTVDLVVLDIRLEGMNGIEVLRHIKKAQPAPIVFVLTNFASEDYRATCLNMGADGFYDKSTEFEEMIAHISGRSGNEETANSIS